MKTARRVKQNEAKAHFDAGGGVAVSEHGHLTELAITAGSTVHTKETTTWADLVADVRMWRSRYTNQRFYVVPADV